MEDHVEPEQTFKSPLCPRRLTSNGWPARVALLGLGDLSSGELLGRIASDIDAMGGSPLCFRTGRCLRACARASMRAAMVASYPWSPGT